MKKNLENKIYSREEALTESLKYFKGDELAANVWINKYALKDSSGKIYESNPDQMHKRLAKEIARIEKKYDNPMNEKEIYGLLKDFKYIVPQGGPMTGIGNDYQIASLSNCFVIGHDEKSSDSYGAIMKIDEEQVQLMKRRGGVGHDLSYIRPNKSPVQNSALTSTGVVGFMERYSNSTREVAQDGRRGALMLSISSKHPDAEHFIDAKMEQGKITGANISVRIDDEFMRSVIENKQYTQQYPIDSNNPIIKKEINANKLWSKIVHNAWKSAEPGILFWDTIIRESIPDCYADQGYKTVSTNPCGEIPLCPYDSCRLLAINLYGYVDKPFTKDASFDDVLLKNHVKKAQRIMDDIIDLELEKIDRILEKVKSDPENERIKSTEIYLWEEIRHKAEEGRRTGVGITAEGDMLAALDLRYGSNEAIEFSTEVQKTLAIEAYRSSVEMAKERGKFKIYDSKKEKNNPFIKRIKEADPQLYKEMIKYGRRNISLLTIAPTGTVSLMTQTTSGIEPVFSPIYKRKRKVNPNDKDVKINSTDEQGDAWEEYNVVHHKFLTWMEVNNHDTKGIEKFNDKKLEELIKKSPYYQATANNVDWVQKIKMQGAVQKWVDHSISVTVNLPKDTSEEKVGEVYKEAWKAGCKGVTVYRDGSREGILSAGKEKLKRKKTLDAEVIRFSNNKEDWIAFIGLRENGTPYEIFTGRKDEDVLAVPNSINKGKIVKVIEEDGTKHYDFQYKDKNGYGNTIGGISHQFNPEFWNYAIMTSGLLRSNMPTQEVTDLLASLSFSDDTINTWHKGVIRALRKYIPTGAESKEPCPDCEKKGIEAKLIYQEGCMGCSCGFSKC